MAKTTSLIIAGTLTDTGVLGAAGATSLTGRLVTSGSGTVQLGGGLTMHAGSTLASSATGAIAIGSVAGTAHGVVTVEKGGSLVGAGAVQSAVQDNGGITASGGALFFTGKLGGPGTVAITANAVLSVTGSFAASALTFLAGGHETAAFGTPTSIAGVIKGFVKSDVIDLHGFVADKLAFAGQTLTIERSSGSAAHLTFAGAYKTSSFAFATDHHGGTDILHT